MKLIKRGDKDNPNRKFRGECRGCGSIFEGERSEFKQINYDFKNQINYVGSTCLICGDIFILFPYDYKVEELSVGEQI